MYRKRISIFTGHFGSGKTEVAVNYAIELSIRYPHTAVVDLDIINPFFRTADVAEELESRGIKVVAPVFANTNVDVSALPPDVYAVFSRREYRVVLDVGGDDLGAKVLSRYHDEIANDEYETYFVINTRRPETSSEDGVIKYIYEIEESSGFKVDFLVNNTNILLDTTEKEIIEGGKLVKRVSEKLGIPVGFTSGLTDLMIHLQGKGLLPEKNDEVLCLRKLIKLPWE